MSDVNFRELAPREGFQSLPEVYPTQLKLDFIQQLIATEVSEIEACSFVRPDRVPQMADAEQVASCLPTFGGKFTGLYLNRAGFQRAKSCVRLSTVGWIHVAASDKFLQANSNTSLDHVIADLPKWRHMFDEEQIEFHGLIFSTVFGSSFDGVIEPSAALRVLHRVLEGLISAKLRTPAELVVADTTGYGAPTQVSQVFTELNRLLPTTTLTAHFHDTRGTGMANVLAALEKEVRSFETSLGGLGGCPFEPGAAGNVPTEDVAYLCEREGLSTGYNFAAAKKAFDWFESATGVKLGGKYGRVGK